MQKKQTKPIRKHPKKRPRRKPATKRAKTPILPAEQGETTGVGPGHPPKEHQFQPGVSGNPAGRPPNGGSTIKEWANQLILKGTPEAELVKIAACKTNDPAKRIAADWILTMLESGDMADFDGYLIDGKSLSDLRDKGVNTKLIKKAKKTAEGGREIELHDRAREARDSLIGHTDLAAGEIEKYNRIDAGKATENFQYQPPVTQLLPLPDHLKAVPLPPPKEI